MSLSRSHSRVGTPSIPPGLGLPHGHPSLSIFSTASSPASTPAKPLPLPTAIGSTPAPVKDIKEQIDAAPSPRTETSLPAIGTPKPGEVSLGSPKARKATLRKESLQIRTQIPSKIEKSAEKEPVARENQPAPESLTLDLTQAWPSLQESAISKPGTPTRSVSTPVVPPGLVSRSGTPSSSLSKPAEPTPATKPRVIRVIDTTKTEVTESPEPTGKTQVSQYASPIPAAIAMQRSRRPSIATMSRPDTPASEATYDFDVATTTSASVSRTGSPPPASRIGTAPVRTMTKSQAKKERKMKAKQAEALEGTATPVEVVEETSTQQAPIMGRKRKTKKEKPPRPAPVETPAPESKTAEAVKEEAKAETETEATEAVEKASKATTISKKKAKKEQKLAAEAKAQPKLEPEVVSEPAVETPTKVKESYTLEQLLDEAENSTRSVLDLLLERTDTAQYYMAQILQDGLDISTHPLFNPTNLNQRMDMKCAADDLELVRGTIALTEEQRRTLESGQPVHIVDGNGDPTLLKNRRLITPEGSSLRCLSEEEEARVLELEASLSSVPEWMRFGLSTETPRTKDFTNRLGNLATLFSSPQKFGLRSSNPQLGTNEADRSGKFAHEAIFGGVRGTAHSPAKTSQEALANAAALAAEAAGGDWHGSGISDLVAAADTASFLANNNLEALANTLAATSSNGVSAASIQSTVAQNITNPLVAAAAAAAAAAIHAPPPSATASLPDSLHHQSHHSGASGDPATTGYSLMTDQRLKMILEGEQKEIEQARKDADAFEKKINAAVKKGKKIVAAAGAHSVRL